MINVTAIKVSFLKEVGELSPQRISAASEVLGKEYPNITKLSIGTVFVNPQTRKHFLLASNQLTVGLDGAELEPDFERIQKDFLSLFSALMLDQTSNTLFDFVGVFPDKIDNAFKSSFSLLDRDKRGLCGEIPGIDGVGLRFFYKTGNLVGDFKIEPFVQDTTKYFMQLQLSSADPLNSIEEVINLAKDIFEQFTGPLGDFAEGLVD